MHKYLLYILIISFVSFSCKRFDSNAYNIDAIQGDWKQVLIAFSSESEDSNHPNYKPSPGYLTLSFENDSCFETIKDQVRINKYSFFIKNYTLILTDSLNDTQTQLHISKLTSDSLILYNNTTSWKYVRDKKTQSERGL